MANNPPFMFGGAQNGTGQSAPSLPSAPQQNAQGVPNSTPQQAAQQMPLDMSLLQGVSPEQMALIVALMQNGTLPFPPPPPDAPAGATPAQMPAIAPASNTPLHPPAPLQTVPVSTQREEVDMEKEEGEIEDVAMEDRSTSRMADAPAREIPKGPRNAMKRNMSSHNSNRSIHAQSSTAPRRASNAQNKLQDDRSASENAFMAKEKQSKEFILAMHQAGYTYRQLAETVDDPKPLRRMFKLLGLPVSSDHGLTNGMQPPSARNSQVQSPNVLGGVTRSLAEPVQQTPAMKPPTQPKPAAKPDRSAYLAKLQALKAGKSGSPTSQATPPAPAPAPSTTAAPASAVASPAACSSAPAPTVATAAPSTTTSTPASKAVKTELARQRLEAFKAERAAKQAAAAAAAAANATNATSPPASTALLTSGNLGAGPQSVSSQAQQQTVPALISFPVAPQQMISPPVTSSNRSFSGLPGLSFNNAPQQLATAPTQPIRTVSQPLAQASFGQTSALPRKSLVTDDLATAPTPSKRPFGQSRSASEDESFIIENSDDEDEDTPMDLDKPSGSLHARLRSPDQPAIAASSGTNTPGGASYEQKLKAIEELNRKIAEKEARRKAQDKVPALQGGVRTATCTLPGIFSPTANTPASDQAEQSAAMFAAPERPVSAGASKLKQQKEELRQRIAELENARRIGSAVVQSTDDAAPSVASAATLSQPGVEATSNIAAPSAVAASNQSVAAPTSEDGEVDDESDFDFYGDDNATDNAKPPEGTTHVDSQATTVSEIVEPEVEQLQTDSIPGDRELRQGALMPEDVDENVGHDGDVADAAAMAEITALPVVGATPNTAQEISNPNQAQAEQAEVDVDMNDQDSGSDESSDDDGSDLNGSLESDVDYEARADGYNALDEDAGIEDKMDGLRRPDEDASSEDADEVESSDASSTRLSDSDDHEPEPATVQEAAAARGIQESDDLASELRPEPDGHAEMERSDQHQAPADDLKTYYKPYQSIMTKFKDYRYHPGYLEAVPSGFHSRTWNHAIDPNKPLCQVDALGGTCRDKNCEFQHFDKMAVSDNMLLQEMGTKNIPARTKEERNRWSAGLQQIISKMKAEEVRDAATIAARIAQYRREFTGDPSRVISMG